MRKLFSPMFLVVVMLLVAAGLSAETVINQFQLVLFKYPLELRKSLTTLPERFGPLVGELQPRYELVLREPRLHADMEAELGTTQYISWTYRDHTKGPKEPGAMIRLHVPYYTGTIDTVPHVTERCSVAGGAVPFNVYSKDLELLTVGRRPSGEYFARASRGQAVRLASNVVPMRLVQLVANKPPQAPADTPDRVYTVSYFFVANGAYVDTPEKVRAKAFDLSNHFAYHCKVELTAGIVGTDSKTGKPFCIPNVEDTALAEQITQEFLSYALPEIVLCLPDWQAAEEAYAAGDGEGGSESE